MRLRQGLHLNNHHKEDEEGNRASGDHNNKRSENGNRTNTTPRQAASYIVISALIICFVLGNYFITINTISTNDSDHEVFDLQDSAANTKSNYNVENSISTTAFFRGATSHNHDDDNHKQMHSILPKRHITIFGTESSGTTFLATTLAIAANVINNSIQKLDGGARNADGSIEIQHLSLPWGMWCESETDLVHVVDAMVPVECLRSEEAVPWNWMDGRTSGHSQQQRMSKSEIRQQCRKEVAINNESNSCGGAKCGTGKLDGYALYPSRFSVNITSHIDWYLQRGVDITVIISTRDRSISKRGKKKLHCNYNQAAKREDEMAVKLMREGLEKYGPFGSIEKNRLIVSPYEALLVVQDEYLFDIYRQLGINSTYVPSYRDGNRKYVIGDNANVTNVGTHVDVAKSNVADDLPNTPVMRNNDTRKDSLLPKKLITVVSLERPGGSFLSETLSEASSMMDDVRVQHLQLPHVQTRNDEDSNNVNRTNVTTTVDVLLPDECFCYQHKLDDFGLLDTNKCLCEDTILEREASTNGKSKCGPSGTALYPEKFYVNLSSHMEWYLARDVDVQVVVLVRDKTISITERLKQSHYHVSLEQANAEYDTAIKIIREAYRIHGQERVLVVSYEGLMQLKESYLFVIYKSLGIESTYLPDFIDENERYVSPINDDTSIRGCGWRLAASMILWRLFRSSFLVHFWFGRGG